MPLQMRLIVGVACFFVGVATARAADTGREDNFTVVGSTAMNYKTVSFQVGDKNFDPNYVTFDLGLTLAYRGFYLSANYDVSLKDFVTLNNTPSGAGGLDNSIATFSREDVTATFGYNVWRAMNVFVGYRQGQSSVFLFSDLTPPETRNTEAVFQTKGPFLGASYGFAMGNSGILQLSAAYASMSGESTIFSRLSNGTSESEISKGPARGYSLGVGWSGTLEGTLVYTVAYKFSNYKFTQEPRPVKDDFSSDEVHKIFTLGVQKYF